MVRGGAEGRKGEGREGHGQLTHAPRAILFLGLYFRPGGWRHEL